MKAIIISALLFFSVRAMSETAQVGQDLKGECKDSPQSSRVNAPKIIVQEEAAKDEIKKSVVVPK